MQNFRDVIASYWMSNASLFNADLLPAAGHGEKVPLAVMTKVLPNLPHRQFHGTVRPVRATGPVSSAIRLVLATRVKLWVSVACSLHIAGYNRTVSGPNKC